MSNELGEDGRSGEIEIKLTPAQAKLFVDLCTLLLSPSGRAKTISELKLNVNASENLLRSLRRRFEKALKKGGANT